MSTEQELKQVNNRLDRIEDKVDKIDERQDAMDKDLAQYKGAIGAALVIVTSIVAFVRFVWAWVKEHVTWQ